MEEKKSRSLWPESVMWGLSNAVLLSQHNRVLAVDIAPERVEMVNRRRSPIADREIEEYLAGRELDLTATENGASAYARADFIVIATPTNYDSEKDYFNTDSVEEVIARASEVNPRAVIVIKSTVPVGFTGEMRKKYANAKLLFSPEFLREEGRCTTICIPAGSLWDVPGGL